MIVSGSSLSKKNLKKKKIIRITIIQYICTRLKKHETHYKYSVMFLNSGETKKNSQMSGDCLRNISKI